MAAQLIRCSYLRARLPGRPDIRKGRQTDVGKTRRECREPAIRSGWLSRDDGPEYLSL
jgi:hypothetical protein